MSPLSVCCANRVYNPSLTWHAAVDVIRNNMAARQTDLRLYLDVIPDPGKVHLTLHAVHIYSFSCTLHSRSSLKELSWFF